MSGRQGTFVHSEAWLELAEVSTVSGLTPLRWPLPSPSVTSSNTIWTVSPVVGSMILDNFLAEVGQNVEQPSITSPKRKA